MGSGVATETNPPRRQKRPAARPAVWRAARVVLILCAASCLLWITTIPSVYISSAPWESALRLASRICFMVRFPALPFAMAIVGQRDHEWPAPVHTVSALLAPFLWYAAFRAYRVIAGRMRLREHVGAGGPKRLTRRRFIGQAVAGVSIAAGGGLGAYVSLVEPSLLRVRRYAIPIADLDPSLDGTRLVHISDTHYGPFISMAFLERVLREANQAQPDLVILTGDYVHQTAAAIEPGITVFRGIEARLGAVAVLGNHDHWAGAEACRAAFRAIDLPLINNARLFVTPGGIVRDVPEGPALCIAGVGDLWEDSLGFDDALRGVPERMPRIMLAHNPDSAEHVPHGLRIDLLCAGHTHGGQVCLPGLGTPIVPSGYGAKYAGGLVEGPRCRVLVSRGAGMALLPVRFRVPPEIGVIDLVAARPENQ